MIRFRLRTISEQPNGFVCDETAFFAIEDSSVNWSQQIELAYHPFETVAFSLSHSLLLGFGIYIQVHHPVQDVASKVRKTLTFVLLEPIQTFI